MRISPYDGRRYRPAANHQSPSRQGTDRRLGVLPTLEPMFGFQR
jgi:hypothetical protein